jgi:hypothetical protein
VRRYHSIHCDSARNKLQANGWSTNVFNGDLLQLVLHDLETAVIREIRRRIRLSEAENNVGLYAECGLDHANETELNETELCRDFCPDGSWVDGTGGKLLLSAAASPAGFGACGPAGATRFSLDCHVERLHHSSPPSH